MFGKGSGCFTVGATAGLVLGVFGAVLCYFCCWRPCRKVLKGQGLSPGKLRLGLFMIQTVPQNQPTAFKSAQGDRRGAEWLRRNSLKVAAALISMATIGAILAVLLLLA